MKKKHLLIAVIDGQGGGIGRALISRLSESFPEVNIIALGTNAVATSTMMRAGTKDGATGENAVIFNSSQADIIAGPIGIIMPNGLSGEVSPKMAEAVGASRSRKFLIPSNHCNICLATGGEQPLQLYIDHCIKLISDEIKELTDD